MLSVIIAILKTLIMLGVLVIIHEGGHFAVAKLCKVKVNEFSIGFGKSIWSKEYKGTMYSVRIVPFGGYVAMEGEEEESEEEGSFSKCSFWKKLAIASAGPIVNIVFGLLVYFILISVIYDIQIAFKSTLNFAGTFLESIKMMLTGGVRVEDFSGPVGIANIVSQTSGIMDFIYLLSVISLSLGLTNLLPVPPLDGGKILIYIIEGIKRKPLKTETSLAIQMLGFMLIIGLSVFVMYNDVIKLF